MKVLEHKREQNVVALQRTPFSLPERGKEVFTKTAMCELVGAGWWVRPDTEEARSSRQKRPTCIALPALHNHLGTCLKFPELLLPESSLVDLGQGGPSLCNKREQGREGLAGESQYQVKVD